MGDSVVVGAVRPGCIEDLGQVFGLLIMQRLSRPDNW